MLGLALELLVGSAPGIVVSCGVPYLIVELADLASTQAVRLRLDLWERALAGFAKGQLLVYTRECEPGDAHAHLRLFAPASPSAARGSAPR